MPLITTNVITLLQGRLESRLAIWPGDQRQRLWRPLHFSERFFSRKF